ncbi:MAG: SPASM domain-containing protein [Myxococcota bacterium]
MRTTITLVHKNCSHNCSFCAYGKSDPVGYGEVQNAVETLMRQGYRVHLYDFDVGPESLSVYRLTRQFEGCNPGWLNVLPEFDPSPEDLDYINHLRTAIAISLHGSTPEVHRRASGKNNWGDIVAFIRRYPERYRLPLGINYVVSRRNLDDMAPMIELCLQFKLEFLEFIPMGYSGNAVARMGPDAILSSEEKHRAWRTVADHRDSVPFEIEMDAIWGPDFDNDAAAACRFFASPVSGTYCNAGINHFAIRLNDRKVFPCPCMAGIDELAIGEFDNDELKIGENWLQDSDRFAEPCASCDRFSSCRGGCRLTAISDYCIAHGTYDRYAGFDDCLFRLTRQHDSDE